MHSNPEFPEQFPYRRVLDLGFVALIDVMGDDASIVQAARVSYGRGTKTVRTDQALINYLLRHRHTTPSEMVEFKFLIRLPVFAARQIIRHRTASVNEYSGRYSEIPDRFWVPSIGSIAEQDVINRQGRTDHLQDLVEALPDRSPPAVACAFHPEEEAVLVARDGSGISRMALLDPRCRTEFAPAWSGGEEPADMLPTESYVYWTEQLLEYFPERKQKLEKIQAGYRENNERCYAQYMQLLEQGVAREIARCVLPLTMYTEWYWKMDLHNLLHFLKLRMAPNAQLEVRAYGEAIGTFVKEKVPQTWAAFEENVLEGVLLAREEIAVMRAEGEAAHREVLTALYERGYRKQRLMEYCRKLRIDERIVDEMWPPEKR